MKKQLMVAILLVSFPLFTVSLLGADDNLPSADAKKVWSYITETNTYLGWGFWPGYVGIYPGKSPHGAFLKLYANPTALKAAREGKMMPYGAILIKENYAKDKKTLMAVTPMYRIKGYNPEGGDWFWAKYDPSGKVLKSGKVKGCIDCHTMQKSSDWLFTQPK